VSQPAALRQAQGFQQAAGSGHILHFAFRIWHLPFEHRKKEII
jgi:hypothetical protein